MDALLPLIIQLISGAAGGNIAGSLMKGSSLGVLGNSIAGILGGGLGGQILGMIGMAATGGEMDVAGIISAVAGGGVGGGVVMAVSGVITRRMS